MEVRSQGEEGIIGGAADFTCVVIIPATLRIVPGTLKLGKKGTFTASITSPELSRVKRAEISKMVCEGALAKSTPAKIGRSARTDFDKEDLINVTAGDAVTFYKKHNDWLEI